jgi:hypothetical protein
MLLLRGRRRVLLIHRARLVAIRLLLRVLLERLLLLLLVWLVWLVWLATMLLRRLLCGRPRPRGAA